MQNNNRPYTSGPEPKQPKVPPAAIFIGALVVVVIILGVAVGSFLGSAANSTIAAEATLTPLSAMPTTIEPTATVVAGTDPTPTATQAEPTFIPDPEKPLAGRRIGLDPGHGPRDDMGAVYQSGGTSFTEAEFNLDVALRCRDLLVERGAAVVVTREENDTFVVPWPNDANGDGEVGSSGDELQTRIDIINDFKADVFLSIHANSAAEPGNGDDLQVLYCGASDCPFPEENIRLSKIVLAHLDETLTEAGIDLDGGSTMDDLEIDDTGLHLFMLGPSKPPRHPRAIEMPGVLGETLYITLPSSAKLLMSEDVRQEIALAYADALQEYLLSK